MAKFRLTSESISWLGRTLFRIKAECDFGSVKKGDNGGFVEKEDNLSQDGNAWVYGNARVSGDALVSGNAWVYGDASVSPINIIGLRYPVTITDQHMLIGCEFHLISEWREFEGRRIAQMDGRASTRFWTAHKSTLLGICDSERPQAKAEAV